METGSFAYRAILGVYMKFQFIYKELCEKNNDDENYISNMLKSINSEWINDLFDISYSTRVEELFASGKIKIIT